MALGVFLFALTLTSGVHATVAEAVAPADDTCFLQTFASRVARQKTSKLDEAAAAPEQAPAADSLSNSGKNERAKVVRAEEEEAACKGHSPVCDPTIVADTCKLYQAPKAKQFYGGANDNDLTVLNADEISAQTRATKESVIAYLKAVGVTNLNGDGSEGAYDVKCMDLCEKTTKSIPSEKLPICSDMACMLHQGKPKCMIDVSDTAFKNLTFDMKPDPNEDAEKDVDPVADAATPGTENQTMELEAISVEVMKMNMANLFRVYPLASSAASESKNTVPLQPDGTSLVSMGPSLLQVRAKGSRGRSGSWPQGTWVEWMSNRDAAIPEDQNLGEVVDAIIGEDSHLLRVKFLGKEYQMDYLDIKRSSIQPKSWINLGSKFADDIPLGTLGVAEKLQNNGLILGVFPGTGKGGEGFRPGHALAADVQKGTLVQWTAAGQLASVPKDSIGVCDRLEDKNKLFPEGGLENFVYVNWATPEGGQKVLAMHSAELTRYRVQIGALVTANADLKRGNGEVAAAKGTVGEVVSVVRGKGDLKDFRLQVKFPEGMLNIPPSNVDPIGAGGEAWQELALKVAAHGQAYVAKAVMKMGSQSVPETVKRWYGNNELNTRTKIHKLLDDVNSILRNVEYKFPGDRCSPNSFAYVFPQAGDLTKNSKGQYIVYLCNLYMTTHLGEQIETLTHEASHHRPPPPKVGDPDTPGTTDICQPGTTVKGACTKAYGETACKRLAQQDATEALKNADNFCYYVNDVAEHYPAGQKKL